MGVSWKKPAGKEKPPRRGATPHSVCTRAKVGYDLQLALDPFSQRQRLGTKHI